MSGVFGRILPPLLVVVLVLVAWTSIVELFDIKEYLLAQFGDVFIAASEKAPSAAKSNTMIQPCFSLHTRTTSSHSMYQ